jgi:hypothetical protein
VMHGSGIMSTSARMNTPSTCLHKSEGLPGCVLCSLYLCT